MFWRRLQSGFMMCFIPMGDLIDSAKPKSCVNLREEALSRRQIKTDSPNVSPADGGQTKSSTGASRIFFALVSWIEPAGLADGRFFRSANWVGQTTEDDAG